MLKIKLKYIFVCLLNNSSKRRVDGSLAKTMSWRMKEKQLKQNCTDKCLKIQIPFR